MGRGVVGDILVIVVVETELIAVQVHHDEGPLEDKMVHSFRSDQSLSDDALDSKGRCYGRLCAHVDV